MSIDSRDTMTAALQRMVAAGMKPQCWHVGEELCSDLDRGAHTVGAVPARGDSLSQYLFMGVPLVATARAGADWVLDTDAGFSVFGPGLALRVLEFGETVARHAQSVATLH